MKANVFITPASRVGGEFPKPILFRSRRKANLYAQACRAIGQKARVVRA